MKSSLLLCLAATKVAAWERGLNSKFDREDRIEYARSLLLHSKTDFKLPLKDVPVRAGLPGNYSSIESHPECPAIADIWDQSACASCYVLSTVMSAADRVCVATQGNQSVRVSAEHMLGCCNTCGNGCAEGFPPYAWNWMASHGAVTGGEYGDHKYCSAYSLPQCEHHATGQYEPCGGPLKTPDCPTACDADSEWPRTFDQDLVKFKNAYQVKNDDDSVRTEIYEYGSVTAEMNVYSDFLDYKSGVYVAAGGDELGGHAVRIIGWGHEENMDYWLVANSWNRDWGNGGYFKIKTGNCGINLGVYGGQYL